MMINPKLGKRLLESGPVVRHVHNVCSDQEAYITYIFRAHANESYIAYVLLVDKESERAHILASSSDTHKHVYEAYRCPELQLAIVRLRMSVPMELSPAKDLIRFLRFEYKEEYLRIDEYSSIERLYKPKRKFDVRIDHVNSLSVKRLEKKLKAEVHVIRSAFFGSYEKIFLSFDGEHVYEEEEKDEIPLIE